MKKWLKIILGIIGVIILLFVIDLVFIFTMHRPLFAIKESGKKMYKGLLYDTYICDEQTVLQIKAKSTKFVCSATDDLNQVNNKIIEYFSNNGTSNYENYAFNYVDEENQVVVVGLLDNSKEEQEKFKETAVNSDLIKFVQSGKSMVENDNNFAEEYTFIRTYHILNIADSNNEKYLYLTIRQFQDEEVQTVKVEKNLCPSIEAGKNYEFTLKTNQKLEDNIQSIFNNSIVVSITETDKVGLEQIQDSI